MIKQLLAIALAGLPLCAAAHAQSYQDAYGTNIPAAVIVTGCANGARCSGPVSSTNPLAVSQATTPWSTIEISAALIATSAAASSLVLKPSAGNLFSLVVTATDAGYVMIFDATSAPADGAVTPTWVYPIPAGGAINMDWSRPLAFTHGITVVFSSTGPFAKTADATAYISGQVL